MSENRGRDSDATPGFNFSDEGTGAVAFHHDARLDTQRLEEAVQANVILGVILPVKTYHWFVCSHLQSDAFTAAKPMLPSNCDANPIAPQRFKFQTNRL